MRHARRRRPRRDRANVAAARRAARPAGPVDAGVARHVAALVDDGATMQCGLGVLPEIVLRGLAEQSRSRHPFGTIGDAVVDLMERGVVTNARKTIDRGVTIAGNMMGGARLHRFAHRNPTRAVPRDRLHARRRRCSRRTTGSSRSTRDRSRSDRPDQRRSGGRRLRRRGRRRCRFHARRARSRGGLPIVVLPARAGARSRIVARFDGPVSSPRSDAGDRRHRARRRRSARPAARRASEALLAIADPDAPRRPRDALRGRRRLRIPCTRTAMRRAAIVSPLRTPVGTFGGSLRGVPVEDARRHRRPGACSSARGIDPARIDDVVFAQSYANGETPCIGRWVALAGRACRSRCPACSSTGAAAAACRRSSTAAMMVQTGAADVVLAGGVESMSNIEYYTTDMRWGARAGTREAARPARSRPRALAARGSASAASPA